MTGTFEVPASRLGSLGGSFELFDPLTSGSEVSAGRDMSAFAAFKNPLGDVDLAWCCGEFVDS